MFLESVVQDKTAPMKILCQPVKNAINHIKIMIWSMHEWIKNDEKNSNKEWGSLEQEGITGVV